MSNQSPHVPKFGEWDVNGERGEQQYTLIFNNIHANKNMKRGNPNDPAFLAELLNPSSSSSQDVVHDEDSPPPPALPESPPPPVKPTSMNHKNQSPRVPKFGEWDVDGESGEQQFTLVFNNMHTNKIMKKGNPNGPAFVAELLNPSSSSSQAVVHDMDSPPAALHESPPPPVKPTSMIHKNPYPQVPKFGEWDVDGESGGQQEFTLIFDNMHTNKTVKGVNPNDPAFLSDFVNSSSSSSPLQAAVHVVNQLPAPPLLHDRSQPPLKPTSRSSVNHKKVMAPKFGYWNVKHPKEYTAIFDELKQEKRHQHASTHVLQTSTFPTPLTTHKPFFLSWRQCFNSGHAVRD